jgi:hypothetical protein
VQAFFVASLIVATSLAMAGYVVMVFREGHVSLGKFFGRRLDYSWSSEPIRFVLALGAYIVLVPVMGWAAIYAVIDVEPVLWTLWPGWAGPITAAVLLKRDRAGADERIAAAASDATTPPEPITNYRTAPSRDDHLRAALDGALAVERRRRLVRIAPVVLVLAPAVAFAMVPPPSGAWTAAGAGVPLVLIAIWVERRAARAAARAAEWTRAQSGTARAPR